MGATISYSGKHVVITGGSEGIGFALAERFLGDGAIVSLVSRCQGKLDDARSDLLVWFHVVCCLGIKRVTVMLKCTLDRGN
jgi:NAD(P)-dependent dehydrogenase (short-subunit alcohol dehydrogenase family)